MTLHYKPNPLFEHRRYEERHDLYEKVVPALALELRVVVGRWSRDGPRRRRDER